MLGGLTLASRYATAFVNWRVATVYVPLPAAGLLAYQVVKFPVVYMCHKL